MNSEVKALIKVIAKDMDLTAAEVERAYERPLRSASYHNEI